MAFCDSGVASTGQRGAAIRLPVLWEHELCFVFVSANGGFIWEELTTCFTAAAQERSWICCRARMLFDELQLKFNEGKFVSTVRQPDPGSLPSSLGADVRLSVRDCCRNETGTRSVFRFEWTGSSILSRFWEIKKLSCLFSCSEQTP